MYISKLRIEDFETHLNRSLSKIHRNAVGKPKGTNCAPLVAFSKGEVGRP